LAYDELAVSHKKLSDRNTDTCKQLEEHKNITNKLEDERFNHQAKISELNNKVTLLNSQFSHVIKQVKKISTGTNISTSSKRMLSHPERGEALLRGVKTKDDCYKWVSQQEEQNEKQSRMLHTIWKHQDIPNMIKLSHFSSISLRRNVFGRCSSLKTNKTNLQLYPMKDYVKGKIVLVKDLLANKNTDIVRS